MRAGPSDGRTIWNYAYPDKRVATGKVRGTKDDSGDNYIYSVLDMKVYLDKTYGEAENYKGEVSRNEGSD